MFNKALVCYLTMKMLSEARYPISHIGHTLFKMAHRMSRNSRTETIPELNGEKNQEATIQYNTREG